MFQQIRSYYQNLIPQLEDHEWESMRELLTVQTLKKGEILTRNGQVCKQVSFIDKGLLRMYYLVEGKEVCTAFVPENNYLAQYDSFLTRQPSAGNIDALEDSLLINLSYDNMQHLYNKHPVFQIFGRHIAEMLFIMCSSQTNALLTLTPEERYQRLLDTQPFIVQRVPQYMIASYIGITPEHLSRLRRRKVA